jgi:phosphohistidine phosphatase
MLSAAPGAAQIRLDRSARNGHLLRMVRILALLRHGVAAGQAPESALLPEGARHMRMLAHKLGADDWRPAAIVTSPYLRALASAQLVAAELGFAGDPIVLDELEPEGDPEAALTAIRKASPLASPVLAVSHLPLVGRLVHALVGADVSFSPGTFVELAQEGDGPARLVRRITPRDLE